MYKLETQKEKTGKRSLTSDLSEVMQTTQKALKEKQIFNLKFYPSRNIFKNKGRGFPGGAVVKNLPANTGDTGLSPGPGRSHMPWSN